MWDKEYRDYPKDTPLIKEQVESGRGIIGCEMHDINGWGDQIHISKKRKKGLVGTLLDSFFSFFRRTS